MEHVTCFNPRAHAGRDAWWAEDKYIKCVSIHAPTRGATPPPPDLEVYTIVSIHAPTRGATPSGFGVCELTVFQSTRPRGARHLATRPPGAMPCFNPRAHAGRDLRPELMLHRLSVSIHAPTRGATAPIIRREIVHMFQSTRPRGARLSESVSAERSAMFQSTRPRGARPQMKTLPVEE